MIVEYLKNLIKIPIRKAIDWYIIKYHSDSYIHKDEIVNEIGKRIQSVEDRVNRFRDKELNEKISAERKKHKIIEDGYIAEIISLERKVEEAMKMRKEVEKLYFKVKERAQQIVLIAAETKQERVEVVNDLSSAIGKLDNLVLKSEDISKEIDKNKEKEEEILKLK